MNSNKGAPWMMAKITTPRPHPPTSSAPVAFDCAIAFLSQTEVPELPSDSVTSLLVQWLTGAAWTNEKNENNWKFYWSSEINFRQSGILLPSCTHVPNLKNKWTLLSLYFNFNKMTLKRKKERKKTLWYYLNIQGFDIFKFIHGEKLKTEAHQKFLAMWAIKVFISVSGNMASSIPF